MLSGFLTVSLYVWWACQWTALWLVVAAGCLCLWSECLQLISCWVEVSTRVVLITMAHHVSDALVLQVTLRWWHKLSWSQSIDVSLFAAMQSWCCSVPLLDVIVREVLFVFWELVYSGLLAVQGQTGLELLLAWKSTSRLPFNAFVGNQDRFRFSSWRIGVVITPSSGLIRRPEINCLVEQVVCLEFQFS